MGLKNAIFTIFAILLFSSCNGCEEDLSRICPAPVTCVVDNEGYVRTDRESIIKHTDTGECSWGRTYCDEDYNILCGNFTRPAEEKCDGLDNNCDGLIDNGLSTDNDNDGFNSLDSCLNPTDCDDNNKRVNPSSTEVCNGIDDNCDEAIDDIAPMECFTGPEDTIIGPDTPCTTGIMKCVDGALTNCEGQVLPEWERCDSIDNDCDGEIDEDVIELQSVVQRVCGYNAAGICAYGTKYCVEGDLKCFDAVMPENEQCDGLDNDCDGTIDEDLYQPCETDCGIGLEQCYNGGWYNCTAPLPETELCDGLDNDCDGEVDEGCLCVKDDTEVCRSNIYDAQGNQINCGWGIRVCDEYGNWGTCIYQGIEPEACDGWDNDCDGVIDGMTSMCGAHPQLHGIGECRMGTSTCTDGQYGDCDGEVLPAEEVCDGIDNDCDGEIDEDLNAHDKVDMIFVIDISGSMCPYIQALYEGISAYVADFADTEHRFGLIVHPSRYLSNVYGDHYLVTSTGLVSAAGFSNLVASLDCDGGGWEKTTDLMMGVVDPANPLNIPWRQDAYPYVISISDEGPQSVFSLSPSDVGVAASNCQIGACEPGDPFEIYFIDGLGHLPQWENAAFGDPNRTINIYPPSGARYTEILRDIFQDVCF